MPMRRGVWGKKGSKAVSTRKENASPKPAAPAREQQFDYSRYYDKCYSTSKGKEAGGVQQQPSRGQFDDLVLLENVSNEGIVEVSGEQPFARRGGRAFPPLSPTTAAVFGCTCVLSCWCVLSQSAHGSFKKNCLFRNTRFSGSLFLSLISTISCRRVGPQHV